MTIQEFKDEIVSHYMDEDNQVTVARDPTKWTTGNGLLHLGIFYTLLYVHGAITPEDSHRFYKAVYNCFVRDDKGKAIEGLLNRNPGRGDKEAHDDYIGVSTADFFLRTYISDVIYGYGEENKFSYDNTNPFNHNVFSGDFWSSWHGRFPGLIGHYQMCASVTPSFFQTLCIKQILRCGVPSEGSATILLWLRVQVAKRFKGLIFKKEVDVWEQKFAKRYGNLGDMFTPYFGSDHPFSRLSGLTGEMS